MQIKLKKLYTVVTVKGQYDRKDHLVVVLCDESGTRYVWHTTSSTKALSELSTSDYVEVKCSVVKKYECGDIQIERIKVV